MKENRRKTLEFIENFKNCIIDYGRAISKQELLLENKIINEDQTTYFQESA